MTAKAVVVLDQDHNPLPDCVAVLNQVTSPLTNSDGYALFDVGFNAGRTYLVVFANGYKTYIQPVTLSDENQNLIVNGNSTDPQSINLPALSFNRPSKTNQKSLPAFDPSDSGGLVHTTPPPELVIPKGYSLDFWRGDFAGVTLDEKFGDPPYFDGANTTPRNMLMSPMLIEYPRLWQDRYITAYCQRNYSHFVVASTGWNLPYYTAKQFVDWCLYLKSFGSYVVFWGNLKAEDEYLTAAVNAKAIDIFIVGEEINTKVSPEQLDVIINANCQLTNDAGIPTYVHFTSNYPIDFPLDTYIPDWSVYHNKLSGLCWQANQDNPAGMMGAYLWYARQRVATDLSMKVVAFELLATNQLYGRATEEYGCLRSLEMLYCPSIGAIPAVAGGCNGLGRYPDGTPI